MFRIAAAEACGEAAAALKTGWALKPLEKAMLALMNARRRVEAAAACELAAAMGVNLDKTEKRQQALRLTWQTERARYRASLTCASGLKWETLECHGRRSLMRQVRPASPHLMCGVL